MRGIILGFINTFFDWLLNQRYGNDHPGKKRRRVRGVRSASTLGTYWKVFRLVYERATDEKIKGEINRKIHRVSRLQILRSSFLEDTNCLYTTP
jgi:hypothetical protein